MSEYITKNIEIEKTEWEKLKEDAKYPRNRRPVGKHAGITIKDHLHMKTIWRDLINELDDVISHVPVSDTERAAELYRKRELLELAFSKVGL